MGAIVGAIVGILVIGGAVAGYFWWKKNRVTAPIVPLRTGADGLEEPLLVAQPSENQAATGVSEFVAEAQPVAASPPARAAAAPVAAVVAAAVPGEPVPLVAEPAAAEPLPQAAVDDGVPGTASTGLIAGAHFGGGLNVLPTEGDSSDATGPDVVVAFDLADIETDDSHDVR